MADIAVEIKQHIGVLSENPQSGWQMELNLVSWNDKPAKLDIRSWDTQHEKCSKGITLTTEEARALKALLNERIEL